LSDILLRLINLMSLIKLQRLRTQNQYPNSSLSRGGIRSSMTRDFLSLLRIDRFTLFIYPSPRRASPLRTFRTTSRSARSATIEKSYSRRN